MTQERLKIAVFVDFDNIEIGVKTTLGGHFDIGIILEAIKERGEVVTKIAYGDWTRAGDFSRLLTQHAIRLVQRNLTPGGDKNGADINLALDALEMVFTHEHINAFVIVGGDSDFITLVEKLKQYDKTVFVVGGRAFTSVILQRNCHEFIAYENLTGTGSGRRAASRGGRPAPAQAAVTIVQAFPLVRRALKLLSDREVSPQLGLLKSTLLQLDSTFSERNYGATSFRDFADKLAEGGLVNLKQAGRSVLVELTEGEADREGERPPEAAAAPDATAAPEEAPAAPAEDHNEQPPLGQPADAVQAVQLMFQTTTAPLRWPMYIRNIKQIIKANNPTFDERRYGFGGILDFLRACQRENLFRLERDRNGGLRVYPGAGLARPTGTGQAAEPGLADAAAMASGNGDGEETPGTFEGLVVEAGRAAEESDAQEMHAGAIGEEETPAQPETTPAKRSRRTRRPAGARKTAKGASGTPARRPAARKPRAKRDTDTTS